MLALLVVYDGLWTRHIVLMEISTKPTIVLRWQLYLLPRSLRVSSEALWI